MKQDLLFIEAEGRLYRGFGRLWPIVAWDAASKRWSPQDAGNPQPDGWGQLVTVREAERLYPGSTTATLPDGVPASADLDTSDLIRYRPELFDDYDGPSFRRSPEEDGDMSAYFRSLSRPGD